MVSMNGPGDVLLLENLRLSEEEEVNDGMFARSLAGLADIYVNEAFSVSHRRHASIVGVPEHLPSYAGFRLAEEVKHLEEALTPPAPFVFVLGGAKFETKVPLIRKFAARADTVFVGGALANDLFEAKGLETGTSLVSHADFDLSDVLERENVILPEDVITDDGATKAPSAVEKDEAIMDAGPASVETLAAAVKSASFVVWNGPLGDYEHGYTDGTLGLAKAIGQSEARSVVGGGDTLAAIEELNILDQFSFVSTGGGAMLSYLAHEDLPGLKALRESAK